MRNTNIKSNDVMCKVIRVFIYAKCKLCTSNTWIVIVTMIVWISLLI